MGDEDTKQEEFSKMFINRKNDINSDRELALEIFHKFNIDRDTLEDLPAFESTFKPLFWEKKDK